MTYSETIIKSANQLNFSNQTHTVGRIFDTVLAYHITRAYAGVAVT